MQMITVEGVIRLKSFARLYHLPVIERTSRRKLGTLDDIYVKKESGELIAIEVTNENIFYRNRLIYAKDILRETPRYILVSGFGERYASVLPEGVRNAKSYRRDVYNKRVMRAGEVLGKIKDCSFDFETGQMNEIELGKGLAEDLLHGRSHLPLSGNVTLRQNGVDVGENQQVIPAHKGIKNIMKGE